MRTWIILGCLTICYHIEPTRTLPMPFGIILGIVIIAGLVMDVTEFVLRKVY